MQNVLLVLALFLFGNTQFVLFAQQSAPQWTITPQSAEDPSSKRAREVIDRTILALGGDAYMNIHDVYQEGRTSGFSRGAPTGSVVPFARWFEYPDKERLELLKTHEWVMVYNTNKGWESTYHGTHPVAADELKQYLERRDRSLDSVLRGWTRDPKTIYFFEGELYADAKQTYSVTLINSANQSVTLMVDKQTYLPMKKSWADRDEYKEKFTEEESYDQYRLIQGIQTAFVTARQRNQQMTGERFLSQVIYNKSANPTIFTSDYKGQAPK
jgi:hypothetical protein